MPAPDYPVVGVTRRGRIIHGVKRRGAPTNWWMCSWGQSHDCAFVIWRMPTRKAWMILDIRKAFRRQLVGQNRYFWTNYARSERRYPSEDAAVMKALHLLAI